MPEVHAIVSQAIEKSLARHGVSKDWIYGEAKELYESLRNDEHGAKKTSEVVAAKALRFRLLKFFEDILEMPNEKDDGASSGATFSETFALTPEQADAFKRGEKVEGIKPKTVVKVVRRVSGDGAIADDFEDDFGGGDQSPGVS